MNRTWINGKFFDSDKAKISVFDRGFMYGDGVFETMRSYAGIIFKLDAHLDRLLRSLEILKIRHDYSKNYLKNALYKSLQLNKLASAYIKLTITRGVGRFGISYEDSFVPNLVIVAKEFEGYPDWMFGRGISAKVIAHTNDQSTLSKIKTLNYLPYILARFDAQGKGFDEAILINTKGHITEGATSNIFLVKRNSIVTPSLDSGILPGVTRSVIIDMAKRLKISVKERPISHQELLNADEVFLTNSLAEVLPVTRVDSKMVGDGRVGDLTKLLHISYQKRVIKSVLG